MAAAAESTADLGKEGERLALRFLYMQRYDILDRNYRCRLGEIDLIAYDGPILAFIEVKTRSANEKAPAVDALEKEQQGRIRRAADHFRKTRKLEHFLYRFDLVAIDVPLQGKPHIDLIRNAF